MSKNMSHVYQHSADYAREHGEMEAYRVSLKHNRNCKEAIEAAIRKHFDGMHLGKTAAAEVVQEYGLERVLYVLASTVQLKDWDGRFSNINKKRLGSIQPYDSEEERLSYMVESHSAVLDGFISQLFKAYETEV